MPNPGPILTETILAIREMKAPPGAIFMPMDRWEEAWSEMADWCGEKYGAPVPFCRSHYDMPHFLLRNCPCIGVPNA